MGRAARGEAGVGGRAAFRRGRTAPLFGLSLPSYASSVSFAGFDRITVHPEVLGGRPCVRGLRLSVERVLEVLAENPSWDDLRADYPELEAEDVRQVLAFAAAALKSDGFVPFADPAA